jgi:hypothetical protein
MPEQLLSLVGIKRRLRVCCHERARSSWGRCDESHFVTDGDPVLSIDSGRAIGARGAEGEMYRQPRDNNQYRCVDYFHDLNSMM